MDVVEKRDKSSHLDLVPLGEKPGTRQDRHIRNDENMGDEAQEGELTRWE